MRKWPHPPAVGPLHFVTVTTHKRIPLFTLNVLCHECVSALAEVRARFPFEIFAYVLLPDHFHLLIRPAHGDVSRLLQKIKSLAARKTLARLKVNRNYKLLAGLRKARPGRRGHFYQVFQESFRDLHLWSLWMVKQKIDYIHKNPLNERLAVNVAAYPWSSWRAIHERCTEPIAVDPLPF